MGDPTLNIFDAILLQGVSAPISWITNGIIGELVRMFFFYNRWREKGAELVLAIPFMRFFDICFILSVVVYFNLYSSGITPELTLGLLLVAVIVMLSFLMLPKICKRISYYLIKYQHTELSLRLLGILKMLEKSYDKMKLGRLEHLFIISFITLLIWGVELASLVFLFKDFNSSITYALKRMANNALLKNVIIYNRAAIQDTTIEYNIFFLVLIVITLVILITKNVQFKGKE